LTGLRHFAPYNVTSMSGLATVYSMIDSDDVLLVMSDHGMRNPMEHKTGALGFCSRRIRPRRPDLQLLEREPQY
jgi:hypothetical protein